MTHKHLWCTHFLRISSQSSYNQHRQSMKFPQKSKQQRNTENSSVNAATILMRSSYIIWRKLEKLGWGYPNSLHICISFLHFSRRSQLLNGGKLGVETSAVLLAAGSTSGTCSKHFRILGRELSYIEICSFTS